jgi:UPF0042 nucleotide-binding protein
MTTTETPDRKIRLVLVTGLSGSGKSSIGKCFEDLDFYTVDNLPLPLLREMLANPLPLVGDKDAVAVVADVRTPGFAAEFPDVLANIDRERIHPTLLFLEASDEVLIRRFSETRRPHPLASDRPLTAGIEKERALMADLRAQADLVFDTSDSSIHDSREFIYKEFARRGTGPPAMVVSLVTFGFKHGIPRGSDLVLDVRFLPNPYFEPGLRELSGRDAEVMSFLREQPDFGMLLEKLHGLLEYLLPRYQTENRSYLSVAIGCTGGHHRSVAVGETLRTWLKDGEWPVRLIHRDLESH